MADSIVIHRTEHRVTPEYVLRAPRQAALCTWSGSTLVRPYRWTVVLDPETLWFGVEFPKAKPTPPRYKHGEFVEWLAQQGDVAELFLMDAAGQYQEFHITGDGAWWAMTFSGYRTRAFEPVTPQVVIWCADGEGGEWRGVLGVSRAQVAVSLVGGSLGQVSACLHEAGEVSYVSSAGAPNYEPDFHDRRSFQLIEFA